MKRFQRICNVLYGPVLSEEVTNRVYVKCLEWREGFGNRTTLVIMLLLYNKCSRLIIFSWCQTLGMWPVLLQVLLGIVNSFLARTACTYSLSFVH